MRILVVGATGRQGGGVARHLLRRPHIAVRALTRYPKSPAACALRRRGVEMVEGDLNNRAATRAALKDCYGVFGVTSSAHLAGEDALGINLVNAVAGSTIEHFVLSALPPIDVLSGGVHHSRQCQSKSRFEDYARSLQLPATYLHPAPYFETLPGILARHARRLRDSARDAAPPPHDCYGSAPESSPRGMPAIAAEDIGGIVGAVFEQPEPLFDRTIMAVGDRRPLQEYAALLAAAPAAASHDCGASCRGVTDLVNARAVLDDLMPLVDFLTDRKIERHDLDEGRVLHPAMQRYDSWLRLTGR